MQKIEKYFSKHIYTNSLVHIAAGIGIGGLLTHTLFDPHPVRFSSLFLVLAALGLYYAYSYKGK